MAGKNIAVFGIFSDQLTADNALNSLKEVGIRHTDVSVLIPDNQGTRVFAYEESTRTQEGVVTAGSSGAIAGAGPFIAAGPLMGTLEAAALKSTIRLAGALVRLGIPAYEAKRYDGRISVGASSSVHGDNAACSSRTKYILQRAGSEDVSFTDEAPSDFATSGKPLSRGWQHRSEFLLEETTCH